MLGKLGLPSPLRGHQERAVRADPPGTAPTPPASASVTTAAAAQISEIPVLTTEAPTHRPRRLDRPGRRRAGEDDHDSWRASTARPCGATSSKARWAGWPSSTAVVSTRIPCRGLLRTAGLPLVVAVNMPDGEISHALQDARWAWRSTTTSW